MNEQSTDYSQLTQKQVPLEEAADAFILKDENGRVPIIIMPTRPNRVNVEIMGLAVLLLIGGIIGRSYLSDSPLPELAVTASILVFLIGIYLTVRVRIPEGVNALLMAGGQYKRTIGSGPIFIPPWVAISHLITRREIPFDVPLVNAPTKDSVRANVDTLITFLITDPYRFVYSISANDFDQVFQAMCQDSLRLMIRQLTGEEVINLTRQDLNEVVESLNADVTPYGVSITRINITYAQPIDEFMQSLENRQLSIVQQAEEAERQALAKQRQANAAALARQKAIADVGRDKELLELALQKAKAQRDVVAMDAEAEELRLAKLQERLDQYPEAMAFDVQTSELNIARALAGNSKAVLQIGSASDIVRTLLVRDAIKEDA